MRRNPLITRTLYYSKDMESFATGLKRIIVACEEAGCRVEFEQQAYGFVVCFYRPDRKNDKEPIKADKKPIKADKKPIKADKEPIKNERKEKILTYLNANGTISNKEARELLGLADSTVKRILKAMVEEELLAVAGERKARRYFIKK